MSRMSPLGVVVAMLSLSAVARASDTPKPLQDWRRTVVSIELTSVRAGQLSPLLEYALSERFSLTAQLELGWSKWSGGGSGLPSDSRVLSLGGELGVSGFLSGRAPDGLWLSARFGGEGQRLAFSPGGSSSAWTERAALLLGYTRVFPSGLSLQVGFGPSLEHTRSDGNGLAPGMTAWSGGLRALAAVGFAF